jgi:hypothetical protein
MKIRPYIEKLEESEEYKNFKIKYPNAFLVAGFFILDLESDANIHQIDFYMPSQKKIAAFSLDGEVQLKILDSMNDSLPDKLELDTNIDLDALSGILTDEMRNRGMSEDIKKIIAVIQNIEGKRIWNLNCVLTGMEVLKSHVEDESQTVLKIEKTSILDIMKKMPAPTLLNTKPSSKESVTDELKKLDRIEKEIEKAKEKLKEELQQKKI